MKLDIATGVSAKCKTWKNEVTTWGALSQRLRTTKRTPETVAEYAKMDKRAQSKAKDVGGYVGAYLIGGTRKPECVQHRQLLTLDIDFADDPQLFWGEFTLQYGCAAILHSTHSHREGNVRLRLIIPLDAPVTATEYEAIGRKVASTIGMGYFDPTTFEPNRLMFWASTPKDGEYILLEQTGAPLNTESVLSLYTDPADRTEWEYPQGQHDRILSDAKKQQDPTTKRGTVGIFCRAYTIYEAIEEFLKDQYEATDDPDRYTYSEGSTAAGLVIYNGAFAYSHHASDPAGEKLSNAFDLVRVHKFADLNDKQSYKEMETFARGLPKVKQLAVKEVVGEAREEFKDFIDADEPTDPDAWRAALEFDNRGDLSSSAKNFSLIIANDAGLKGIFSQNTFDNKRYLVKSAPWREITKPEPIRDVDYSGVRNYIESIYKINSISKVDDALSLEFNKNSFHPVRDYLNGLEWDKVQRVDRLLIEYFGAPDNQYTREAITISLAAAVARIFEPGTKFDYVLTLIGKEGVAKSTFFRKLGLEWFSDTFTTVQGKEAFEQLAGAWIIEMAELAGLRKAEAENVKHFISKCSDSFRPAYARTTETFQRQCVFFGTTNDPTFLKFPGKNRRFMPIEVREDLATKGVWEDLTPDEVGQIWAEAVQIYKDGVDLYLSEEADKLASITREDHTEADDRAGVILDYLNTELPTGWESKSVLDRRYYLTADINMREKGVIIRDRACAYEVWTECLGNPMETFDRYKSREINDIMRTFAGWERGGLETFTHYGRQRAYRRVL